MSDTVGAEFVDALSAAEAVAAEAWFAENRAAGARCRAVHATYEVHERAVMARVRELGPGEPDWATLDPFEHACQSLVATTGMTTVRARDVVLLAVDVHDWAGPVLEAMESGLMCERIAMLLCSRVREVDPDRRAEILAAVVEDYLNRLRTGQRPSRRAISGNADKVVARLDPEGVEERRQAAATRRSVRFRKDDDGMCTMTARLTSAAGAVLAERIDAFAKKSAAGDDRTLDQRRADALVAMATGEHVVVNPGRRPGRSPEASTGTSPDTSPDTSRAADTQTGGASEPTRGNASSRQSDDVSAPVNVSPVLRPHITVITTGSGEPKVEFTRTGESALDMLTRLLAASKGATFELTDIRPGTHDRPDTATRYRIPADLARRVRLRDGTCRHPGCSVPAEACDIDHIVPFDPADPTKGGLTVEENLGCLCRRHHRYKTFSGARYDLVDGARLQITIGPHVLTTEPTGPLSRARAEARVRVAEWEADRDKARKRGPRGGPGAQGGMDPGIDPNDEPPPF